MKLKGKYPIKAVRGERSITRTCHGKGCKTTRYKMYQKRLSGLLAKHLFYNPSCYLQVLRHTDAIFNKEQFVMREIV